MIRVKELDIVVGQARKIIVYSLAGIMLSGVGVSVAQAAPGKHDNRQQQEQRNNQDRYQDHRQRDEHRRNEWQHQDKQRMARYRNETPRRNWQWSERAAWERREREEWQHQELAWHEWEMRRRAWENEREWHERQRYENERYHNRLGVIDAEIGNLAVRIFL
jgi:hypothetical protein